MFYAGPNPFDPICKLVIGETFTISIVNVLPPKNIVDHLIPIAFWEMTNVTSVCHNLWYILNSGLVEKKLRNLWLAFRGL